jgi:hypothetical protein
VSDLNVDSTGSGNGPLRDSVIHEVAKEALLAALASSRKHGATCKEFIYALIIIAADIFVCTSDDDNSVFLDTAKHTLEKMRALKDLRINLNNLN